MGVLLHASTQFFLIPTVVDRLVQQAINQVLTPIYENQFCKTSYGFRPIRGCHDALRGAQRIINEGYIYVVDLDLERFFDTVSHSKLEWYPKWEPPYAEPHVRWCERSEN